SCRAVLNGAEPVNPETLERFCERFAKYGFRREALLPVYGLAEASLAVTVPPLGHGFRVDRIGREMFTGQGRAVPAAAEDRSAIAFVSSGLPIPQHEVKIVDKNGQEVAERIEGDLWFRGPSATRGYYRNPQATEKLFPCGPADPEKTDESPWVDSGDRAYIAAGEVYVTGRVKDIIIKAGRNIYPHEAEEAAGRAEGVRKGCVVAFGLKDAGTGTERLAVVAETRETQTARRAQIAQAIKEEVHAALGLPPDVVELIPAGSIPKTSSGKLRREETKRLYVEGRLEAGISPAWMQIARLGTASALRAAWQSMVRGARRALQLAYGVYALVVFGIWIVPAWALVQLMPNRRAAARFTSAALKVYLTLVGCRVRVAGREHLDPARPQVLVSNHTSYFDALALMAALGVNYRFVAKIEVGGMPFISTFLKKMGHYAFDRSDPQARLRQAEEIEETLRRGESVLVFPEGTFTPYEGVRPFQLGAFKAAVAAGCPICPVSLRGTRRFLRDGTVLPRATRVLITISPPIEPPASEDSASAQDESSSDWHAIVRLRDAAREAIAQHSGEPLL
ncbi:MAG TPA: 1-acyl-sn-glycerol-3-phosphate acyltransferase, partial [Candidatus Acidoferrales bacterium]|nr:1-acyl-sn-glycerol-3-phosphate acyltransferase [Candidatus Acidoferrales bacterium]